MNFPSTTFVNYFRIASSNFSFMVAAINSRFLNDLSNTSLVFSPNHFTQSLQTEVHDILGRMDDRVAGQFDLRVLHEQIADRVAESVVFSGEDIGGCSFVLALISPLV